MIKTATPRTTPRIDINEKNENFRPDGKSCLRAMYTYHGILLSLEIYIALANVLNPKIPFGNLGSPNRFG
tara:strand:+ start:710 stop:919 length:210 start_codon:yes stop_codon:yes gene_type:complete